MNGSYWRIGGTISSTRLNKVNKLQKSIID
jgi:hypothetical protein